MTLQRLNEVHDLIERVTLEAFGHSFRIRVERDNALVSKALAGIIKDEDARPFLQLYYTAPCTKTGTEQSWAGRKWYLSQHMLDDEIIKTCYAAFEAAVKHEVMEGFKVDGTCVFNPHVDFEELLKISGREVSRKNVAD